MSGRAFSAAIGAALTANARLGGALLAARCAAGPDDPIALIAMAEAMQHATVLNTRLKEIVDQLEAARVAETGAADG